MGLSQEGKSPSFLFMDGTHGTKKFFFSTKVHQMLSAKGYNPTDYSGHSFQAGSATTAMLCGLSDHEDKLLGCWSSDA